MITPRSTYWWCVVWLLAMASFWSCSGRTDATVDASFIHIPSAQGDDHAPKMRWNTTRVDLGMVAAGETRELIYTLTNAGDSPLILTQVLPSCGCTVAKDWDTTPLPAGQSRDLTLEFASGDQTRSVEEFATVVTNAIPATVELTFTAQVIGPDPMIAP